MASLTRASSHVLRAAAGRQRLSAVRSFSSSIAAQKEVKNVTVFGAGLMGAGIAQVLAHKGGYNVTLSDVTDKAVNNGQSIISKSLARIAKKSMGESSPDEQSKFVKGIVDSIKYSTDPQESVRETDLVIEAIIENIDIKRQLFELLDKEAPQEAIFASNTSSLAIKDIAAATKRLDRFGGFHAFNPVPQMKLVEIVRTNETSQETFDTLTAVAKQMGKVPVSCVDVPGFIVNRLLVPYMLEAVRLVERGEATAKDVDTAMKLGAGYPMGPFELGDLVGLDTLSHIAKGWRETRVSTGEINAEAVQESKLLEQKVKDGKYGMKSGAGWYEYPPKK